MFRAARSASKMRGKSFKKYLSQVFLVRTFVGGVRPLWFFLTPKSGMKLLFFSEQQNFISQIKNKVGSQGGSIAQRQHSCFSLSSPRFDSQRSRKFFSKNFSMSPGFIDSAVRSKVDRGLENVHWTHLLLASGTLVVQKKVGSQNSKFWGAPNSRSP